MRMSRTRMKPRSQSMLLIKFVLLMIAIEGTEIAQHSNASKISTGNETQAKFGDRSQTSPTPPKVTALGLSETKTNQTLPLEALIKITTSAPLYTSAAAELSDKQTQTSTTLEPVPSQKVASASSSSQEVQLLQNELPQQSSTTPAAPSLSVPVKSAPVLRPSIEEVASELSRKYLNLERHKQAASSSLLLQLQQQQLAAASSPVASDPVNSNASDSAELDVMLLPANQARHPLQMSSQGQTNEAKNAERSHSTANDSSRGSDLFAAGLAAALNNNEAPYLQIDTAVAAASIAADPAVARRGSQHVASSTVTSANKKPLTRRKKMSQRQHLAAYLQDTANNNDDAELLQCQQYLKQHSTSYQALVSSEHDQIAGRGASSLAANKLSHHLAGQLLPCSCQQTSLHFASPQSMCPHSVPFEEELFNFERSRVWLNCDNVQLIGNQLFTPHRSASSSVNSQQATVISNESLNDTLSKSQSRRQRALELGLEQPNGATNNTNNDHDGNDSSTSGGDVFITKFSQRDAGLEMLFSQKFHYLQLTALKSIDLSQNRLRKIKMDAFHGLENTLEYLNLARNLLGDSRAMFASSSTGGANSDATRSNTINKQDKFGKGANNSKRDEEAEPDIRTKSMFISDELNRLRKLKWLSLQGNLINQLGQNVFIQHSLVASQLNRANGALNPTLVNQEKEKSGHRESGRKSSLADLTPSSSELLFLDLSDNLMKVVPSEAIQFLNKLQVLRLNGNKIIHLDSSSKFPNSLKYLDLSDNLISVVRHCELIDLPYLIELNLSNNQLRQLDHTAFLTARPPSPPLQATDGANSQAESEGKQSNDKDVVRTQEAVNSFKAEQSDLLAAAKIQQVDLAGVEATSRRGAQLLRRKRATELVVADENSHGREDHRERLETEESETSVGKHEDDLDAEESIFSALTSRLRTNTQQQVIAEEPNAPKVTNQFNSTLRLNLSYNFFENVPGDSLLKFARLQVLDLSFNRIRKLDSNYLCSIYNLVDNLRVIDLRSNLLSLSREPATDENRRSLNKLFGCFQRLEQIFLSTNRLVSRDDRNDESTRKELAEKSEDDFLPANDETQQEASRREDSPETLASSKNGVRLTIKFGENFGSRQVNTLDLSNNQLRLFPLIEAAGQPAIVSHLNPFNVTLSSDTNQARLHQWINSRVNLKELNLNYNYLERIDAREFEHLFNLQSLHLGFNKLTSLPVIVMNRFTSLENLFLAGNRISSLEPMHELLERSMKTLRTLNLANNRLMSWPKLAIPPTIAPSSGRNHHHLNSPESRLLTSSASSYQMQAGVNFDPGFADHDQTAFTGRQQGHYSSIDFALEELNLEGNLLTSINVTSLFDQLIYMKSLRTLNLNYNLLNRVSSEWFKFANKNLQTLSLTGNKINNIDLGAFALNQVNELTHLNLDYNLLKELKRKTFESMPKIRSLNLAHNLIHTINSEAFHQLNSLQVLKLNNNKLTSWKCEYFSYLCNSISGNINVDLATLITSHHHQQQQQAQVNSQMSNLMDGQATAQQRQQQVGAPFGGAISSLYELDLSHNSLSQLRANSISVHTKLVKLDLSHNKLSFIPHDLFKATTSVLSGGRQIQLVSSLKHLNLAHNRLQTIDNINFKPMKNLLTLDLSYNELQSLGVDVISFDMRNWNQESLQRRVIVNNNLTNLLMNDDDTPDYHQEEQLKSQPSTNRSTSRSARSLYSVSSWPALSKLRTLNLSHNALSFVNQSLLSELSPFVALNLDLSYNYLDSDSLPAGFFVKIVSSPLAKGSASQHFDMPSGGSQSAFQPGGGTGIGNGGNEFSKVNYDLVFTIKLESLDLGHNRLSEWPSALLDNHYSSMEKCSLSHNRIQNLPQNSNSLIQIKALNLEFNPLSRDSSELVLAEHKSSRYLNLAATRLYAIKQATADSLQYSNSIHNLKTRLVNQTSQLDLIRSISKPIEAPYLKHLNLSSNQLVWLSSNVFDRMHSLQTLDLSNNQLTRLHLLSNQLVQVSSSLEHLNLGSNLFTSIDATDFNQLTRIKRLDLSNLLSLQKFDCRFLSKLSTLRQLKMYNYPQLRHRMNTMISNLLTSYQPIPTLSERYQQKLQDELIMSTIGKHCFQDTLHSRYSTGESLLQSDRLFTATSTATNKVAQPPDQTWFKLEEIEMELFNNFHDIGRLAQDGSGPRDTFKLRNELSQMLGPRTRKLTLFGLNLTDISDKSLFGIVSDELDLKISFTSLSRLPIGEILNGLTKRMNLKLDLRNNNIQSIDLDALQWLDELQQMNQGSVASDFINNVDLDSAATLKLASNPFRCDCQTRPLWLWLNQRLDNLVEMPTNSDEQTGEASSPSNNANYWIKFHKISQASDLKCFYPAKLRGKLAQHVYYNELICRSSTNLGSPTAPAAHSPPNVKRKRNETTRSSDSYYSTSLNDFNEMEDTEDEDYLESGVDGLLLEPAVKVTRFNRYPSAISNSTNLYFINNFPTVPFVPDKTESQSATEFGHEGNRIGKRDHGSSPNGTAATSHGELGAVHDRQQQQKTLVNSNYNKHRPNTQQKHSHFSTLTNLNNVKFGRSNNGKQANGLNQARHSMLTDFDIMILTIAGSAMAIMSLVIMGVCLFKYKLDKADEEQIINTHSKLIMSRALFTNRANVSSGRSSSKRQFASSSSSGSSSSSSSKSNKDNSQPNHSKQPSTRSKSGARGGSPSRANQKRASGGKTCQQQEGDGKYQAAALALNSDRQTTPYTLSMPVSQSASLNQPLNYPAKSQHSHFYPIVAPSAGFLAPVAQNFLMRSPTIRRMHGLAGNASDWFKYTLRAYPSASGSRRRRFFIQNNAVCRGPSQLRTAKLTTPPQTALDYVRSSTAVDKVSSLNSLIISGCPKHAFDSLTCADGGNEGGGDAAFAEANGFGDCSYCDSLVQVALQAKSAAKERRKQDETRDGTGPAATSQLSSETKTSAFGGAKSSPNGKNQLSPASEAAKDSNQLQSRPRRDLQRQQRDVSRTFQAAIAKQSCGGGFMPPKMIHALAQHLDEQANNRGNNASQRLVASSAHSRDHQTKSMKTFGVNGAAGSNIGGRAVSALAKQFQKAAAGQSATSSGGKENVSSQIPTIDVDGRFAYQSDSHIDSPYAAASENGLANSRDNVLSGGGTTPASTIATNQEDIFILVRDTPTSEITTRGSSLSGLSRERKNANCDDTGSQAGTAGGGRASMMNEDECSRSSSPVAYGFMRSSPSVTTLSSNAQTQLQSCHSFNRSPEPRAPFHNVAVAERRSAAHVNRNESLTGGESRFQLYSNYPFKKQTVVPFERNATAEHSGDNNNNYVNHSKAFQARKGGVDEQTEEATSKTAGSDWIGQAHRQSGASASARGRQVGEDKQMHQDTHEDQLIISRL